MSLCVSGPLHMHMHVSSSLALSLRPSSLLLFCYDMLHVPHVGVFCVLVFSLTVCSMYFNLLLQTALLPTSQYMYMYILYRINAPVVGRRGGWLPVRVRVVNGPHALCLIVYIHVSYILYI